MCQMPEYRIYRCNFDSMQFLYSFTSEYKSRAKVKLEERSSLLGRDIPLKKSEDSLRRKEQLCQRESTVPEGPGEGSIPVCLRSQGQQRKQQDQKVVAGHAGGQRQHAASCRGVGS